MPVPWAHVIFSERTLLRACPELRVLATRRQDLGMAGEVRLRVPPLSVPDAAASLSPGQIAAFDAVALLAERAAAVQPAIPTRVVRADELRDAGAHR